MFLPTDAPSLETDEFYQSTIMILIGLIPLMLIILIKSIYNTDYQFNYFAFSFFAINSK